MLLFLTLVFYFYDLLRDKLMFRNDYRNNFQEEEGVVMAAKKSMKEWGVTNELEMLREIIRSSPLLKAKVQSWTNFVIKKH